eukprot:853733_1
MTAFPVYIILLCIIPVFSKTPTTVDEILHASEQTATISADKKVCVMTRDNICLSTDIYYAKKGSKPWPCVYAKTPHGKITLASTATEWTEQGYCVITQ